MRQLRFALILTIWLVLPSLAHAARVAVLDFRFSHTTAPAVRKRVLGELHATLRQLKYNVLPQQRVIRLLRAAGVPIGCNVGPCLAEVGRVLRVDRVLVGGISGTGSNYDVTMTLLETDGGTSLAQVSKRCDVCTFDDAAKLVSKAVTDIDRLSRAQLEQRAWLVVKSIPRKARIEVNGLWIGEAPLRRLMSPGTYAVQASLNGLQTERRTVRLSGGQTGIVSFRLHARGWQRLLALDEPAPPSVGPPPWAKWLAIGIGVASVAAGATLIALDKPDRNTLSPGIGLTTAGLTSALVGGSLWWVDILQSRKRRRPFAEPLQK